MDQQPKIALSACLQGQNVRFNGGHARSSIVCDEILPHFQVMPICPEMSMGLGVPREPIRLVSKDGKVELMGTKSKNSYQAQWDNYKNTLIDYLSSLDLDGMIVKAKSPSCGLERVACYLENGYRTKSTSGLMVTEVRKHWPYLPIEEEGRLLDKNLREQFLERVFAIRRWKNFLASEPKIKDLIHFHSTHKLQLLAHSRAIYDAMGPLVANASQDFEQALVKYEDLFYKCLAKPTTAGSHVNVMMHLLGLYKKGLDKHDKMEILNLIEDYHEKRSPLTVPLTLLRHFQRKFPHPWAEQQSYWQPFPKEFTVRNLI